MKNHKPSPRRATVSGSQPSRNRTVNSSKRTPQIKSGNKNLSRRKSGGMSGMTTVVPFAYLYDTTIAATSPASLLMNPSVIPTLTSIASNYQNFRFTELHLYLHPCQTTSIATENIWFVGFSSDVAAGIASITATSQISQCMPSGSQVYSGTATQDSGFSSPQARIHLSARHLLTNTSLRWYKCIGDADTNAWENFQCQILFYNATGVSQQYYLTMTGKCEFSSPIPSQLTLLSNGKPVGPRNVLRFVQECQHVHVEAKTADQISAMIRDIPMTLPAVSYKPVYAPMPPEPIVRRRSQTPPLRGVVNK